MSLITQQALLQLVDAILDSGLDTVGDRRNYFQSVNKRFIQILPISNSPKGQLMGDIVRMNEVERLADGQIPLLIYLQNIASFLSGLPEEKTVREAIDRISNKTAGTALPDLQQMPEIREKIIHRDDTVTFGFMQAGLKAASSVMKLQVPSLQNGQPRKQANGTPMLFLGTGWLLSDTLAITNHHVINARMDGEPPAAEADLLLQATRTTLLFDFDADGMQATEVTAEKLVAWSADLDYAVIRIPSANRAGLPCVNAIVDIGSDPIAVNIVQHPNGRSKRYGIRNNLVSAATAKDLRYFTDTESGSSGSPVFDDQWQVVALHRAAMFVPNVQFQGKDTAYVNIGTHISLIINDIKARFPLIGSEIN